MHLSSQTLPSLFLYLSIILNILYVCHFSCPFLFHCLCCVLFCCVLCFFPPEAAEHTRMRTLHHLHLPLQRSPSSSTNTTRIRRRFRYSIYIHIFLFEIPTNYIVSIVVNLIAETLHGKSIEMLFQLDSQFFNAK